MKLVIINYVLIATFNHVLFVFKVPATICDRIDSLLSRFWWKSNKDSRGLSMVSSSLLHLPKGLGGLGIRHIHSFNLALLAKQVWRLRFNPQLLASRVLKAKYPALLSSKPLISSPRPSWGCRGLLEGGRALSQGLAWKIGSGTQVSILQDYWVPNIKVEFKDCIPVEDRPLMVSDLLLHDTGIWNLSLIRQLFPVSVASVILGLERPKQHIDDFVYWKYNRDGAFLTKSAYAALVSQHISFRSVTTDSSWWKRFWGLPILPKWKMLAWKVLHNAFPTADVLALRGIPIDATCIFCHGSSEYVVHLFRECPFTSRLWNSLASTSSPLPEVPFLFSDWFTSIITSYASSKHWLALDRFFGMCWAIWITRNNVRFRSVVFSPQCILDLALEWSVRSGKAREMAACCPGIPPGFSSYPTWQVLRGEASVLWECDVLMCFDGAWDRGNYSAGAAWCFLDPVSSRCIGGGARVCMASSALHSELLACLFGLKHARQQGIVSLCLLTDCLSVPKMIQFATSDISLIWTIQEIRDVISSFSSCHIRKVSRSSIGEAHSLAGAARRRILLCFSF
ncbi:uncharacterized protein LOC110725434 [Chenopodium quinoa]|uniref:uncharacterized protein LOC110725434 n=1 Tax=Chenopodium quinoa TaxID=63459 RepID=UPI000B793E93|nr:uncharacterized protein LOC110725434 [Chenopodium quinoa]